MGGGSFEFPKPVELKYEIKDKVEEDVDESYFLTDDKVEQMILHCDRKQKEGCGFKFEPTDGGVLPTQSHPGTGKGRPTTI